MMKFGRLLAPGFLCFALCPTPSQSALAQTRVETPRTAPRFNPLSLDDTYHWAWERAKDLQESEDDFTDRSQYIRSRYRDSIYAGMLDLYCTKLAAFEADLAGHVGESVTWQAKVLSIKPDGLHVEAKRSGTLARAGRRPRQLGFEVRFLGLNAKAQEPSAEGVLELDSKISKELARPLKPGSSVTIMGEIRSIELKDKPGDLLNREILVVLSKSKLAAR